MPFGVVGQLEQLVKGLDTHVTVLKQHQVQAIAGACQVDAPVRPVCFVTGLHIRPPRLVQKRIMRSGDTGREL